MREQRKTILICAKATFFSESPALFVCGNLFGFAVFFELFAVDLHAETRPAGDEQAAVVVLERPGDDIVHVPAGGDLRLLRAALHMGDREDGGKAPQQAMCRFAAVPTPNSPEPFTLQRMPAHSAIFATVRAGYRPPALVT